MVDIASTSLSRLSGEIVAMKIITIFDADELEGVVSDIKASGHKPAVLHGKVLDCFIYTNNLYLVLEFFENGSLADLVQHGLTRLLKRKG